MKNKFNSSFPTSNEALQHVLSVGSKDWSFDTYNTKSPSSPSSFNGGREDEDGDGDDNLMIQLLNHVKDGSNPHKTPKKSPQNCSLGWCLSYG